jgi:competence protein ComEA
MAFDFVLQ